MNQSLTNKQAPAHKNKTAAALLAFLLGGVGLHRFYLHGITDKWGWLHACSLLASSVILAAFPETPFFFAMMPLILSILVAFLEALVIGLTPDEKWDAKHNPSTGRVSRSGWPLAILLVLTVGIGATGLIAVIARSFDLLFTGGAFG